MNVFLFFLSAGFFLPLHGVSGADIKRLSVKEGGSVTLSTCVIRNQQDDIQWYFNKTRIAKILGNQSFTCADVTCKYSDERFRKRLKLDYETGSLTITDIRNTDSGEYKLVLIRISDTTKIFNVTVSDSGLSAAAGIALVVVLLAAVPVCVAVNYCCKRQEGQQENHLDCSSADQNDPLMNTNDRGPNQTETDI